MNTFSVCSGKMSRIATATAICLLGFAVSVADASPQLRQKLGLAAAKINQFLVREGIQEKSVALGVFETPKEPAINPGPGMFQILEEELSKLSINVSPGSERKINGGYRLYEANTEKREAILLWKVVDGKGQPLFVVNVNLTNQEELDLFFPPPSHIEGTKVFARPRSPLGAEVVVGGAAVKPVFAKDNDKMAYVDLEKGDEYTLKLHNSSEYCMAVLVRVDGINMYAFSEDPGEKSEWRMIVPPNKSVEVPGWYKRQRSDGTYVWHAFKITGFPDSMIHAKKLPQDGSHVGMITLSYRYCHRKNTSDPVPPSFQVVKKPGLKKDQIQPLSKFTGSGSERHDVIQTVGTLMGVPRETIIIRYAR